MQLTRDMLANAKTRDLIRLARALGVEVPVCAEEHRRRLLVKWIAEAIADGRVRANNLSR